MLFQEPNPTKVLSSPKATRELPMKLTLTPQPEFGTLSRQTMITGILDAGIDVPLPLRTSRKLALTILA